MTFVQWPLVDGAGVARCTVYVAEESWWREVGVSVPSSGNDAQLRELNTSLRVIGRLPRILHFLLFVLFAFVAFVGSRQNETPVAFILLVGGVPLIMFLLTLRIKAYAAKEMLVVRSYLKTYVYRFEDIEGFSDIAYCGM